MKDIEYLAEYIQEELHDAEKYAKAAFYHKDLNSELSRLYAELSQQELNHSNMLHEQSIKLIKMQREKGVEGHAAMQTG